MPPGTGGSENGAGGGGNETADCAATMQLLDFKLEPAELEMSGPAIVICVENGGKAPHDLAVRDADGMVLGRTPVLGEAETAVLSLELDAANYGIFCSRAGHESLGMRGSLTVTE
jgi:plastocyanin